MGKSTKTNNVLKNINSARKYVEFPDIIYSTKTTKANNIMLDKVAKVNIKIVLSKYIFFILFPYCKPHDNLCQASKK